MARLASNRGAQTLARPSGKEWPIFDAREDKFESIRTIAGVSIDFREVDCPPAKPIYANVSELL